MMNIKTEKFKRKMTGLVLRNSNDKTIVVAVERKYMHSFYNKFVTRTKKYHAHDEKNEAKVGDEVVIVASRPHSKLKTWELFSIRKNS